jgi:hypothetical protein
MQILAMKSSIPDHISSMAVRSHKCSFRERSRLHRRKEVGVGMTIRSALWKNAVAPQTILWSTVVVLEGHKCYWRHTRLFDGAMIVMQSGGSGQLARNLVLPDLRISTTKSH